MDVTTPRHPDGPDTPDDRDLDEGGLDLTPRVASDQSPRRRSSRRWVAVGVLAGVALVVVFILVEAGGASLYY